MSDQWRILIVEDEEEVSKNIVNSLRKDGYQVQGVVGSAAIRVLWSEEYDVVISDLKTPGAEGFDLLEWVRAYRPNLRMIMLGSPEMRSQALERGAVGFVSTPLDLHSLKEELRRLLQQTGFSASLDSFDLLDVIQIITMSRKDIALLINTGLEERGTLGFKNGDLVWADYGVLRGEEAFFALAAHKNGTVIYQPWNPQIRPNVTQPLSRLIFQALQYRSKYALAIPQTGEQPSVKASDASGLSLLDADDDDSPFLVLQEDEVAQSNQQNVGAGVAYQEQPKASKEWWEGTGRASAISSNTPETSLPTRDLNPKKLSVRLSPMPPETEPVPDELPAPEPGLPSWVTDQPTMSDFPALSMAQSGSSAAPQDEADWEPEGFFKASAPPPPFESPADWEPINTSKKAEAEPEQPALAGGSQTPAPQSRSTAPIPATDADSEQSGGSSEVNGWDDTGEAPAHNGQLQSLNAPPSRSGPLSHDSGKLLTRRLNKGRIQPGRSGNGNTPIEWDTSRRPRTARLESGQFPLDRINQQSPIERGESGMLPIRRLDSNKLPSRHSDEPSFPSITGKENGNNHQAAAPSEPSTQAEPTKPQSTPEPQYNWETPAPPFTWEYEPEEESTTRINPVKEPLAAGFPTSGAKTPPFGQPLQSATVSTPTPTLRRDYPAMVSALQSLGYAVPGFVATALATLDGQPIAQVAVGELDISGLCNHFARMLRSALLILDAALWGSYQQQVIISTERMIILKSLGAEHQVFLVLVTTAQTKTGEALEAIENVEGALRNAL